MRIAFVSTYPPIECGIATYTSYLNDALRKLHNETLVISPFGAAGENVFPIYSRGSASFATETFNICEEITPDLVHIQHEYGLYGSQKGVHIIELILRLRLVGLPVVTTLHTVYEDLNHNEQIILRIVVDESSAIIVHEDYQKETLVRYFGGGENIHVIPHGVRELLPIPDAKEKLEFFDKQVILLCGYFRPTKGFHKIVEWFPEISKQVDDAILVIAGKSRGLEFRDYQRKFFESINSSPVNDKIAVLRGQFPQDTFDTIVSASDVVVLPYEIGAQSGILAQCFAFGKPVITSNLPAFKKTIDNSKGGLTCDTEADYMENIVNTLNDSNLQRMFAENIRNYVKEKVGWSTVAQQHTEVYRSVIRVPYGKAKYVYLG